MSRLNCSNRHGECLTGLFVSQVRSCNTGSMVLLMLGLIVLTCKSIKDVFISSILNEGHPRLSYVRTEFLVGIYFGSKQTGS